MSKKKVKSLLRDDAWTHFLHQEFEKDYMKTLMKTLHHEREKYTIWPSSENVFRAFQLTPLENVKAVIIGQDPYPHDAANGLAFSYNGGRQKIPASLKNILKEVERDTGFKDPSPNPDLTRWAKQGVLLLNTVLTVREGAPGSHKDLGWQKFTRKVIKLIGDKNARPKVFLLWGNYAQKFLDKGYIDPFTHLGLRASHPSPRSAHISFHGCGHFTKANNILTERFDYESPISW